MCFLVRSQKSEKSIFWYMVLAIYIPYMSVLLSNPYFVYPGAPCRGYNDRKVYHGESWRLLNYIQELEHLPMLLHITVGAAMEERQTEGFNDSEFHNFMQWKQLLPDHVVDYALSRRRTPIRVIVISPNSSFSPENFVEPECIRITDRFFQWKRYGVGNYRATTCDMELNFFCTPMPHNDHKRNRTLMKYLAQENSKLSDGPQFQLLEQTIEDRQWIQQFYGALKECFDRVTNGGGVITCYSFAVFNENNAFAQFNNYAMFSEICALFKDHDVRKRLLAEWTYKLDNVTVQPFNKLLQPLNYVVSSFRVCNRNDELLIDFSNITNGH